VEISAVWFWSEGLSLLQRPAVTAENPISPNKLDIKMMINWSNLVDVSFYSLVFNLMGLIHSYFPSQSYASFYLTSIIWLSYFDKLCLSNINLITLVISLTLLHLVLFVFLPPETTLIWGKWFNYYLVTLVTLVYLEDRWIIKIHYLDEREWLIKRIGI
jgi:hypothetical protein